jgi:hypothetical protein
VTVGAGVALCVTLGRSVGVGDGRGDGDASTMELGAGVGETGSPPHPARNASDKSINATCSLRMPRIITYVRIVSTRLAPRLRLLGTVLFHGCPLPFLTEEDFRCIMPSSLELHGSQLSHLRLR